LSKSAKISIIGGVVLILVVLLYIFGFKDKDETYISDNWSLTYDPDDRGPYGTYMLKELLDTTGLFGNFLELNEDLRETLKDDPEINDIYFFVGSKNHLSDSSTQFLLDFVREGNTALMAASSFPNELLDVICYDRDVFFETDNVIDSVQYFKFEHSNFRGKRYSFSYINNNEIRLKTWKYFDQDAIVLEEEEDSLIFLGSNTEDKVNFLKINYGEGQIYLHSTPYSFTNVSMVKREGFQYAENVLKHIPPGRVQWDYYNINWHSNSNTQNNDNGGGGESRRSMLEFIVKNPPLLWALLLLLGGAILYAFFKGKRMQKIIRATESKENMSLKYIDTLSSLYLQEKKHSKLVKLKEKTFLNFIAEHYYIQTNKADEKFIEKVAIKSNVPKEQIGNIFKSFSKLEKQPEVSDQALIELHQKIENFYKTCR